MYQAGTASGAEKPSQVPLPADLALVEDVAEGQASPQRPEHRGGDAGKLFPYPPDITPTFPFLSRGISDR